jgi:DNA-binding NarL/FixJ family response regulator
MADGENLKVSFIPLPYREGGPRRWVWLLEERQDQVPVPWSWLDRLTAEEREVLAMWKEKRSAASLYTKKSKQLSERERTVAAEALMGHDIISIAETLGMSANTVKVHLHNIYNKVGARDRLTLFQRAWRMW